MALNAYLTLPNPRSTPNATHKRIKIGYNLWASFRSQKKVDFTFPFISRDSTWKPDICLLLLSHASLETLKSKTEAIKWRSGEHEISSEESRFAAFNRILPITRVVSNKFLGIPNSLNAGKCRDDKMRLMVYFQTIVACCFSWYSGYCDTFGHAMKSILLRSHRESKQ